MGQATPKAAAAAAAAAADASQSVLRLARRFAAPREAVFEAFADVDVFKKWWGPKGMTCPAAELDVRPGGRYHIEMLSPDGKTMVLEGAYREVTPPFKLVFTWTWKQGDMAGHETLVTLEFRDLGVDGTELSLTHETLPGAEWVERHHQGWSSSFDCLAETLAG